MRNDNTLLYVTDVPELKKIMTAQGVKSNIELSRKAGVSRTTIDGIMKEEVQPSSAVMYKIAAALKMEPERCGVVFFKQKLTPCVS